MPETTIPVLVTVSSVAVNEHGQFEEPMRMLVPGELLRRGEHWLLHYEENLTDEADHTTVTHDVRLLLAPGRVVLTRKGPYGMMLVLEKGKRFEGVYHTPFGDLPMAVYPAVVQCDAGAEKGSIRLQYQLDLQGAFASERRMRIDYVINAVC